jgi:leucyl-tRNA synthetase
MHKSTNTPYDPATIETKWLELWESWELFQQTEQGSGEQQTTGKQVDEIKEKLYLLFAFAYPSGSGLHVGHVESKTALDIIARYNRMQGKDVFFPVGWDAFGLPAENYAIKTGIPPAETTKNAIDTFRRQIKRVGISYDWANEIATCHPEYYKWTQWLFLELFSQDVAYKKTGLVNWCSSCQTVLANEQVVDGKCERCDTEVVQKEMDQWFFKITKYQDELISGLNEVDWPHATKQQQLNWIGKKEGIHITYTVVDDQGVPVGEGSRTSSQDFELPKTITCFTTRPDTNFGATFIVLAPEHAFAKQIAQNNTEVHEYLDKAASKTELERQRDGKKKTGAFTGYYAENQLTGKRMPIWVSDFVLGGFGTGAVVGVPGHDVRDFEFAKAFDIEVIRVVVGTDGDTSKIERVEQVQEEAGIMTNSDFLDGLEVMDAKEKIMDYLEEKGYGERVVTYRLRDWLISRQRYWGAPIPIVYDPEGTPHPVHQDALPWLLPTDVDYNPKGVSPLGSSKEFIARTQAYAVKYHADLIEEKGWDSNGKGWQPEFDTMDTFVDSSWYFLRYLDARNTEVFAQKSQLEKWLPVDFYMIGPEHIVLHLLYSRFFTKFLRDQGYLSINEPFAKMRHQGMILGPDHRKMSKSKGNVINPDDIIEKFGADTLRVYEMFMGPIEADKPWDTRAVIGVYKFLQRVHDLVSGSLVNLAFTSKNATNEAGDYNLDVRRKLHQTLEKVSTDIPQLKFNTAIAAMMECLNLWEKEYKVRDQSRTLQAVVSLEDITIWVKMMAPFAPYLAEELYAQILKKDESQAQTNKLDSVHLSTWPEPDAALLVVDTISIPVQVNGKVRGQLQVSAETSKNKDAVLQQAKELTQVQTWLEGAQILKEIYVPGKIVNFAIRTSQD